MSENPRRGWQARNFTTNVPKILDLKSSSEKIFFRKLSLGAPAAAKSHSTATQYRQLRRLVPGLPVESSAQSFSGQITHGGNLADSLSPAEVL